MRAPCRRRARSSPGSPTAACSRSAKARSRSHTRRSCANGRGCARGSTRTCRAAACTARSAKPRAPGTRTRATPAGSTAARAWRRRSSGAPAHEHELNADERAFLDASRAAAERAQRRLRLVLAAVSRCSWSPVIAGLVALDQRGSARAEGARRCGAGARRAGADRAGAGPLAAARAAGGQPRRLARHAQQPARCPAAQPRRDRRAARRRRPAALTSP